MARYRITRPLILGSGPALRAIDASAEVPREVEFPSTFIPSIAWEPLDDEARAAIEARKEANRKRHEDAERAMLPPAIRASLLGLQEHLELARRRLDDMTTALEEKEDAFAEVKAQNRQLLEQVERLVPNLKEATPPAGQYAAPLPDSSTAGAPDGGTAGVLPLGGPSAAPIKSTRKS